MSAVLTEVVVPMTAEDRCDRCGAQAFYRAVMVAGELTFCGHHGREVLPVLARTALVVEDATGQINPAPSPSANAD